MHFKGRAKSAAFAIIGRADVYLRRLYRYLERRRFRSTRIVTVIATVMVIIAVTPMVISNIGHLLSA
jgi:hypothetical protein